MKKIFLSILFCLLFAPSLSPGEDLYEDHLNRGIWNSEHYSRLLIQRSRENPAEAEHILREALRYSPNLPAVYFELSKANFELSSEGIFSAVDYMIQGIVAYKHNFWWLFTLLGSLFSSIILALISSIIIIILIRLPEDIPLLSHDIGEARNRWLLLLLLILALLGPLFLIGSILVIFGLYMSKADKTFVYVYLLFLLISPWIFNTASVFLNSPASGKLKTIVQVNESKDDKYAITLLQNGSVPVELFSYALAIKREGRYEEAKNIYNKLIAKRSTPQLYNNLANCFFATGDIEKSKELYRKSIELKPLPSSLYNLSQVSRATFDFNKGEEYFFSAQKLDQDAVSMYRSIFSRNPNRFVIDETLQIQNLFSYAQEETIANPSLKASIVRPSIMPVAAVFMVILFYALNKRLKSRAYRCKKCGDILCNECEKRIFWGRMCLQCYRSLVKLDELDAKKRTVRVLRVYNYQKRRRDIIKIISLLIPGSGYIYAGNILKGLLFLWAFLFLLFILITNSVFVSGIVHYSSFWLKWPSIVLMGAVYIISNVMTRRRLARGWL